MNRLNTALLFTSLALSLTATTLPTFANSITLTNGDLNSPQLEISDTVVFISDTQFIPTPTGPIEITGEPTPVVNAPNIDLPNAQTFVPKGSLGNFVTLGTTSYTIPRKGLPRNKGNLFCKNTSALCALEFK